MNSIFCDCVCQQDASQQTDLSLQSFLDVVRELEKLDDVSPEKLDLIEQGFQDIHRVDLVRKIQTFQKKGTNGRTTSVDYLMFFGFIVGNKFHYWLTFFFFMKENSSF